MGFYFFEFCLYFLKAAWIWLDTAKYRIDDWPHGGLRLALRLKTGKLSKQIMGECLFCLSERAHHDLELKEHFQAEEGRVTRMGSLNDLVFKQRMAE